MDIPSEIVLYNDKTITTYIDGKLTSTFEIDDEIKRLLLFPLPNYNFLLFYQGKYRNFSRYNMSIGNYEKGITEIIHGSIEYVNFIHNKWIIPPVIDGIFTSKQYYTQIIDDKVTLSTFAENDTIKSISANIKIDVNDIQTNINNILYWNRYDFISPAANKSVRIDNPLNFVTWFDNKYILAVDSHSNKIIIYDISRKYDKSTNILKLEEIPDNLAYVTNVFKAEDMELLTINEKCYVRTASDNSIDIFLFDYQENIAILHITPDRKFEVENYPSTEHKIEDIDDIMGDEYGIMINDNKTWYYIDRYTKSVTKIGKGETIAFSNSRKDSIKFLKSDELPEFNKNMRGLISEYI